MRRRIVRRLRPMTVRIACSIARRLSLPVAHAIGTAVGLLRYRNNHTERNHARANIVRCFPEQSPDECDALCKKSFVHLGRTAIESPILWFARKERIDRLLHYPADFDTYCKTDRPTLFLIPHIGSWEAAGIMLSMRMRSIAGLFKPRASHYAATEELVRCGRSRFGMQLFPATRGGMRAVYRMLASRGAVCILPDQVPQAGSGMWVPFFHDDAYTATLAARCIRKYAPYLFVVAAVRLPDGAGFRVHIDPLTLDTSEDDRAITTAVNRGIESIIRLFPEQYMWQYDRFRLPRSDMA